MSHKNFFSNKFGMTTLAIVMSGVLLAPALPASAEETNTLTVRAYSSDGEVLHMYTTIESDGNTVKSGYTPLTYTGTTGEDYNVIIRNYEDHVFDVWGNDKTSRSRTVTLWGDTTAVAYYNNDSSESNIEVSETTSDSVTTSDSQTTGTNELLSKTGVMVALYMYPGTGSEYWQEVIDQKNEHPSVPIVAIFNPSNGPGSSIDSNFANWVDKLQDAGVIAIGYVADDYGTKSLSTLKEEADKYGDWYNADGLFIDEFTNQVGYESHYSELTEYVKSQGMKMTLGNPGTDVPQSYIGTVDVINISEGTGYLSITDPNLIGSSWVTDGYLGWHEDYDKYNFATVRYDVDWLDTTFITEVKEQVGLVYVTDGNDGDDRWMHVPPYFGDLVATLD